MASEEAVRRAGIESIVVLLAILSLLVAFVVRSPLLAASLGVVGGAGVGFFARGRR